MNKMPSYPQIQKRNIGNISIIDMKGDLQGAWALKIKSELNAVVESEKNKVIVFNLRPLRGIDSLGVKAMIESFPANRKTGLLSGNLSVMEMLGTVPLPKAIKFFRNEEELIGEFGKHFVDQTLDSSDKRKSLRINTALPLQFKCRDAKGEWLEFHAVVTNLSEGGLFAEYIDLEDAIKSQFAVNPYELKMLDLQLSLPNVELVKASGKVVRRRLEGEQVGIGIEFYSIEESEKVKIKAFLTRQMNFNEEASGRTN